MYQVVLFLYTIHVPFLFQFISVILLYFYLCLSPLPRHRLLTTAFQCPLSWVIFEAVSKCSPSYWCLL
ncbi:hypothetical protein NP493_269g00016 [Ridgeia piscesae]|uniref:Uncharacterized protein n=1 Tax=Ridgeia piscesae TaxID=27915 RepID=A0AAD9NXK2_RIDPI|nr:hypothetical protein NP493_269g00016 [Ridgeia piscesae]